MGKVGGIENALHGCPELRVRRRALHETQPRRDAVDVPCQRSEPALSGTLRRGRVGRDPRGARSVDAIDERRDHGRELRRHERRERLHEQSRRRREAATPTGDRRCTGTRARPWRRRRRKRHLDEHGHLDRAPRVPEVPRDERRQHAPRCATGFARAAEANDEDWNAAGIAERLALDAAMPMKRVAITPWTPRGSIPVGGAQARGVGHEIDHVLGDERAALLQRIGPIRPNQARVRVRRREPYWLLRVVRLFHTADVPQLLRLFPLLGDISSHAARVTDRGRAAANYAISSG